jgi:carboxypeptidase PM20D1
MTCKQILILFTAIAFVLLYRAYIVFQPEKGIFEPCSSTSVNHNHSLQFDSKRLEIFQKLLRYETISYEENQQNTSELIKCRDFIRKQYQHLISKHHTFMKVIVIAEYSLLYSIRGRNPKLKPFLFSAHMDVVPAMYVNNWHHPPFDAYADDEFIFARGTLDNK